MESMQAQGYQQATLECLAFHASSMMLRNTLKSSLMMMCRVQSTMKLMRPLECYALHVCVMMLIDVDVQGTVDDGVDAEAGSSA